MCLAMPKHSVSLLALSVFTLLSSACAGPGDTASQPLALNPAAIACTPGESFCDGAALSHCSRSGADAISFGSCSGGSATNPVGCFANDCPGGATACCRPAKATCDWSFTLPAMSGRTYESNEDATQGNCVAPSPCDTHSLTFYIAPPKTAGTCPTMVGRSAHVIIPRPLPTLGQTVTLPRSGIWITSGSATEACSAWTGSLTVHSDLPTWRVSLNATCSEPGKSHIRLVGTAHGDV
jgi:hypothetical protein